MSMSKTADYVIREMNKSRKGISYWVWPGKPEHELKPSFDAILSLVAVEFGISVNDILNKTRKRDLVVARQMVCYISRKVTDLSYKYIGYLIGGRDHSTVIHSCNKMKDLLELKTCGGELIHPILVYKYRKLMKNFKT